MIAFAGTGMDGKLVITIVCWAPQARPLPHPIKGHGLALSLGWFFLWRFNSGKAFPRMHADHSYFLLMLVFNTDIN